MSKKVFTILILSMLLTVLSCVLLVFILFKPNVSNSSVEVINDKKELVKSNSFIEDTDKELLYNQIHNDIPKSAKDDKTVVVTTNENTIEKELTASIKEVSIKGDFMPTQALNLRKGPSVKNAIITTIPQYAKVTAISKDKVSGWYKVKYNNKTGWVSSSYLTAYKKVKKSTNYKANYIYYGNRAVPYKSGGKSQGQAIIDGLVYASTWGGTSVFSGTDGLNTHFIGHNPGQFRDMHTSSKFIITDSKGNAYTYVVTKVYKVDEFGIDVATGEDKWDRIVGTGGGERITMQSTYKHPIKWIVEASLVK